MSPSHLVTTLIFSVLFGTCLALVVQTQAQKFVAPSKVALIYSLEPVAAAISEHIWVGKQLSHLSILGAALIISGMIVVDTQFSQKNLRSMNI